jgi:hypothetical protein
MHLFQLGWPIHRVPLAVRQLRRVLSAGLRDDHYRALLDAVGLGSVAAIRALDSVDDALARLPFTGLQELPPAAAVTPEVMDHPLLPGTRALRVPQRKARYTALAGSLMDLRQAATLAPRLRPMAELGVLVLRRPGQPPATPADRDLFWDSFQVPVYDIFMGYDGAVLAYECEAQCGLHVTPNAVFEESYGQVYFTSLTDVRRPSIRLETGLAVHLEAGQCECGRRGTRMAAAQARHRILATAAD